MSGFFNKLFGNPEPSHPAPSPQYGDSKSPSPAPAGRPFSVSELANLLPPEFVRLQGVDVNRTVSLNLETAKRTIAEGRPAVMLSEIFQACPEIFPRAVTPEDDFEVRLPVSRVRSLLGEDASPSATTAPVPVAAAGAGGSPFHAASPATASPFQAAVSPTASPFQAAAPFQTSAAPVASPFQAASGPAATSPFQSGAPAADAPASPFQVASPAPAASPFQTLTPPAEPVAPAPVASPFEVVAPAASAAPKEPDTPAAPVPGQPVGRFLPEPQRAVEKTEEKTVEAAPVFSPFRPVAADPVEVPATERVTPMAPVGGGGEIKFDLADSLKAVSADVLGFSAQQLPGGIECKVPASKVREGVFPGTGMVGLRDVVSSLPVAYRSVFGGARLDHELIIPFQGSEAVPSSIPDESMPEPLELMTGPIEVSAPAAPGSAPVFETPFAVLAREDASIIPPAPVSAAPATPVPTAEKPAPEPLAPLVPLAPIASTAPEPAAPVEPAASPFVAAVGLAKPEPEPEPLPLAPVPEPVAAVAPFAPEAAASAPVEEKPVMPPVAAPRPVAAAPLADDDFTMDFRQLELRTIFGLPGVLPPEGVFTLATGLEGVKAAGYFAGDKLVYGRAPDGVSLETMPAAYSHLARMARELGISDARALTIQTERGLLAFFSEGNACLAVLHEGRRFAPGVRERLVIILRELMRG